MGGGLDMNMGGGMDMGNMMMNVNSIFYFLNRFTQDPEQDALEQNLRKVEQQL